MDSPLLPQIRGHRSKSSFFPSLADEPNLLSELSLEESPRRKPSSSSTNARSYTSPTSSSFAKRNVSASSNGQGGEAAGGGNVKPPARKPRFSLFAKPGDPGPGAKGGSAVNGTSSGGGSTSGRVLSRAQNGSSRVASGQSARSNGKERAVVKMDERDQQDQAASSSDDDDDDRTIHPGSDRNPRTGSTQPNSQAQTEPHLDSSTKSETDVQRDDRLRASLFELRKMNDVFGGFLGALESAKGHNERLALRTQQTSALLDHYIELLGQAEHTQRLILNPAWKGGSDDLLHAQQLAEQEALHLETERKRLEEEQRRREEESARTRERVERDKAMGQSGSGVGRGGARGRGIGRGGALSVGAGRGVPGARGRVPSGIGRGGSTTTAPSAGAGRGTGIRQPSGSLRGSSIPRR